MYAKGLGLAVNQQQRERTVLDGYLEEAHGLRRDRVTERSLQLWGCNDSAVRTHRFTDLQSVCIRYRVI